MGILTDSLKTVTHHANLLIGGADVRDELVSFLSITHDLRIAGNPDFFVRTYINLTIDDAREVKAEHNARPVGDAGRKFFILAMNSISLEAQNALLKLLEEPAEYAHFFLIIPSVHLVIPTVRSRMSLIPTGKNEEAASPEGQKAALEFLAMSVPERLEWVKEFMEDITKERKTKQDAIEFMNSLEAVIYERDGVEKGGELLSVIGKARSYMTDRAPSVKMLMESVALLA